jgi:tetratricopeptide (TPR) repeat protein
MTDHDRIPQLIRDLEREVERLREAGEPLAALARPAARLNALCRDIGRYEDALRWACLFMAAAEQRFGSRLRGAALGAIGALYDELKRPERAVRCLAESLELEPDTAGTWFNLANALWNLDRRDEAVDASRKAVSLEPRSGAYRIQLGAYVRESMSRAEGERIIRDGAAMLDASGCRTRFELLWRWMAARMLEDKEAAQRLDAQLFPPETVH